MTNDPSDKILYEEQKMREGKIEFLLPKNIENDENIIPEGRKKPSPGKDMPVFFNDRMVINRDLTLLVVKVYANSIGRKITFLDAMAATGIRSIRLLKETDVIEKIFLNDLNPMAIRYAYKNMDLNNIPKEKYEIYKYDAQNLLFNFHRNGYLTPYTLDPQKNLGPVNSETDDYSNYCDVIDIDPFGSCSQFVHPALQSIQLGGLLCLTATDTPVLFGIRKDACIRKYLTKPIYSDFIKEMGIRILIYYAAKISHIYELYIEPILSISSDHFVRVFFIIRKGIEGVNQNIKKFGYLLYCKKCGYRSSEMFKIDSSEVHECRCPLCSSELKMTGLVWLGNLHNSSYQQKILEELNQKTKEEFGSKNKIKKYLELSADEDKFPPYFYAIPKIADELGTTTPPLDVLLNMIRKEGYIASRTHFNPQGIKTNAQIDVLKRILVDYVK